MIKKDGRRDLKKQERRRGGEERVIRERPEKEL